MNNPNASATTATAGPPAPKCRVLVVDDSPDMIRLVQIYLADPRISVTPAANGGDGIASFRTGGFDLVLMDMEMPVMDGYVATKLIRAWEEENQRPRTPIAALTAVSDFGSSTRILSAGCTLHLTKPISRSTLLQIVNQFGTANRPAATTGRS